MRCRMRDVPYKGFERCVADRQLRKSTKQLVKRLRAAPQRLHEQVHPSKVTAPGSGRTNHRQVLVGGSSRPSSAWGVKFHTRYPAVQPTRTKFLPLHSKWRLKRELTSTRS